MKKFTILLIAAGILPQAIATAQADSYQYKPYIGADYTFAYVSAKGFNPRYHAGGIRIGSEYSAYFGTELFFNQSSADKRRPHEQKIKTSYRSYGLDLLAYLPLDCQKRFNLTATAGIGEYVFKTKFVPAKHYNEHGYGYRFGGGLKYVINNNWQTRLLARYINFDHAKGYNHAMEYTAGIEYHF